MYARTSLWETDELVFTETSTTGGYFDDDENWVPGESSNTTCLGSLQPYTTTNTKRLVLPSGIKEEDARMFYSKTCNLKAASEVTEEYAATTIIDGKEFYVDRKGDWSRIGVCLRHYAYLLIKRPLNPLTSET